MIRQCDSVERKYVLKLADGQNWEFSGTKATIPWLDEFATIMQLSKLSPADKITRKLTFLAMKKDNALPENKLNTDWNSYAQSKVYRIWEHNIIPENFIELNMDFIGHEEIRYVNMSASLKLLFKHYVDHGGGPVHSAFAVHKGKGILIMAPGGTGKSTCHRSFPSNSEWTPLSDDNALIVKKNGKFMIHPMPTWSDHLCKREFTTFKTSTVAPLSNIFFLEQAETNEVVQLDKNMTIKKIYEGFKQVWETYWMKMEKTAKIEMNKKIIDTVVDIIGKIKCYNLKATLGGKFWEEIEKHI